MAKPDKTKPGGEVSQNQTGAEGRPRPKGGEAGPFDPSEVDLPDSVSRLLLKYPCLQRHPHPFIVHFPIVFTYATAFFSFVYLLVGVNSFETTGFHLLGATVLSLPLTMVSGELSRRVNYPREPKRSFLIEVRFSRIMLALSSAAFVWRWLDPSILRNLRWDSAIYLAIILLLPIFATIISYFGGLLTFPLENEED
jgi:uncharacterized membrane protein